LEYLALPDGPGEFMQDSSCPALLGYQTKEVSIFDVRGYHALWLFFPEHSAKLDALLLFDPTTPVEQAQLV
jgi:hypothetical protein